MPTNSFLARIHKMGATPRLLIACLVGLLAYAPVYYWSPSIKFMVVWLGVSISMSLLYWITFFSAKPHEIRKIARMQDSSRPVIFLIVLLSAFVSLLAIILLLKSLPSKDGAAYYIHLALSVSSVAMGWILIHTIFTVRYAHLYYQPGANEKHTDLQNQAEKFGGLDFPGDEEPGYLDFAYFAFVIGMTFQVSDVEISSARLRRIALIQGLLSFAFNAIIVALCINIISGIIEK
ncbi:MAG: DUF1345 domain-containing protein [Chitinophagaceae bacterium]|nr:MAG: DUF1345 domain-containing protein [Chitinophagaceae bacterium]